MVHVLPNLLNPAHALRKEHFVLRAIKGSEFLYPTGSIPEPESRFVVLHVSKLHIIVDNGFIL